MRRVSHYEHVFRAGRGEPVERVPHPEHPELGVQTMEPWQSMRDVAVRVETASATAPPVMDKIELVETVNPAPTDPVVTDPNAAAQLPVTVASAPLRVEFQSSNIRTAELDSGVLTVEFVNGKSYRYGGFTAELLTEWQAAKSAGSWFDANVKKRPDRHPLIGK